MKRKEAGDVVVSLYVSMKDQLASAAQRMPSTYQE